MPRDSRSLHRATRFVPAVLPLEDRVTPAAGDLDLTFSDDGRQVVAFDQGGLNFDEVTDVAVQADGKIVVVGSAELSAGSSDFAVAVLNPDGTPDTTFSGDGRVTVAFNLGGGNNDVANAVAVQADGQIVVAGTVDRGAGDTDFGVIRLSPTGVLDPTVGRRTVAFDVGPAGSRADRVSDVAIAPNGEIVVAGSAQISATNTDFAVAVLNPDGSPDTTFSGNGQTSVAFNLGGDNGDFGSAVAVQADGQVVVAGTVDRAAGDTDFGVIRLSPTGVLDPTVGRRTVAFDVGPAVSRVDVARGVAVQADGKIVVAGSAQIGATDTDFAVAVLNPDGSPDLTFSGNGQTSVAFNLGGNNVDAAEAVAVQDDGQIVVAGLAGRATGADFGVIRLSPTGVLDPVVDRRAVPVSFGASVLAGGLRVGLALQADRRIVLAGTVVSTGVVPGSDFAVARLQGDNAAPVAVDDAFVVQADTPSILDVLTNDEEPDGDGVTVTIALPPIAPAPAQGTAVANDDGTITYTPNPGATGTDTLSYIISDGLGGSSVATVTITLNQPPVAVADAFIAPFDTPVTLDVLANDEEPDGDEVTVTIDTAPLNGVAEVDADGVVTYTPNAGFLGDDFFTYQIDDGQGGTSTATVTITVELRFALAREFGVGLDRGGSGAGRLLNPDRTTRIDTTPFSGSAAAGVRTATADFNGDGVADLVVGTGPGGVTRVRVLDGATQAELFSVQPFEDRFTGGVYVAAGDVDGDGVADLVITPDEGGGPRVRIFSGGAGFGQIADFFGIEDTSFRGGARAAVGDLNGDGVGDVLVAAGFGGGPRMAAFDGTSLVDGALTVKLFPDFFAFEEQLRNGAYVAAGDIDGDGLAELIAGGGPGGGPRVTAFSGAGLLTGQQTQVANFFGGDPGNRGGIRVATKDLDGDALADLVTGSGPGGGSRVTAYSGADVTALTPAELFAFDAQPGFAGGVFVG